MFFLSLATASPSARYTQQDCYEIFRKSEARHRMRSHSVTLMEKVLLRNNGIAERGFCYPQVETIFDAGPGKLNKVFEAEAPRLGAEALEKALDKAGLQPGDLDGLIVCTCTGYLCPGVSSFIAERLGMRPNAELSDLVGMGCAAAIPSLRQAWYRLQARPQSRIAVVAVEICSAAFYLDNDPGVIISACLFGDGAAAAILTGDRPAPDAWQAGRFQNLHLPEKREILRFENKDGALRNRLSKHVPQEAAKAVQALYQQALEDGLDPEEHTILAHTGGRDVLDELEEIFPSRTFPDSRAVLRKHGNMSSPSILYVLESYLNGANGDPRRLWLTSFGAGFTAYSFTLEKDPGTRRYSAASQTA